MTEDKDHGLLKDLIELHKDLIVTVDKLITKIDIFMRLYQWSVPSWMVVFMFVLMLGVFFGKEAIESYFKSPIVDIVGRSVSSASATQ